MISVHRQDWEPLVYNSLSSGPVAPQTGCAWIACVVLPGAPAQIHYRSIQQWASSGPELRPVLTHEPEAHCTGLKTYPGLAPGFLFLKLHTSSKYYWCLFLPTKVYGLRMPFCMHWTAYRHFCLFIILHPLVEDTNQQENLVNENLQMHLPSKML